MTHDEDPTRWTSSPDDAPELLRGAFMSARDEGPSRTQVRSLALKLAAASAGGAVAIGTVKAASAGQAITTAATWSIAKVATVVALAGTLVTGGALVWQANSGTQQPGTSGAAAAESATDEAPTTPPVAADAPMQPEGLQQATSGNAGSRAADNGAAQAPVVERLTTPSVEPLHGGQATRPTATRGAAAAATRAGNVPSVHAKSRSASAGEKTQPATSSGPSARVQPPPAQAMNSAATAPATSKPNAPSSEIELLRRAQVALQSRPREAFQLTQEHRRLYPAGEFAQERDALAIQALMRVGDTEKARDLATSFIRSYPSSPHAHRFREAMGLD